jgi:oxygen-independent coproporphyrinogen III oxidase
MLNSKRQRDFQALFNTSTGVDNTLLERYNLAGPRYTSYPTAPVWVDSFGHNELTAMLHTTKQAQVSLPYSVYIHLPFCESRCHFCACNVVITQQKEHAEHYLGLLFKEIDLIKPMLDVNRPVVQLHFGGGTPTYLSVEQLNRLCEKLKDTFRFAEEAEMSVEVDPRVTSAEQLAVLAKHGFNRVSMGVQDVNPQVQQAINRIQSVEQTRSLIEAARGTGYKGVNVDLIYGLPHQTPESFHQTVETIIRLQPDRLAVYNYAHVPWMAPWQKYLPEEAMPQGTTKYAIFRQATQQFLEAGYVYIGMDHYAKPTDELAHAWEEGGLYRNFMGYTTRAGQAELIGLGLSAISGWKAHFSQNVKKLSQYEAAIEAGQLPVWRGYALNEDDLIRQRVIMEVMCMNRLRYADIQTAFGVDVPTYFEEAIRALAPLAEDGLCIITPEGIELTPLGRIFSRNIAMAFDGYLKPATEGKPLYSKTL